MNISTKLLTTGLLASALFGTAQAQPEAAPSQPAAKAYGCLVMEQKADGTMNMIHQAAFSWDQTKETAQIFHQEGKLVYNIYSEAKSGMINLGIINTETKTASAAVSDMNKVLIVFDSANKRLFGCGADNGTDMSPLAKALSVK